jgi:hypothetical protein
MIKTIKYGALGLAFCFGMAAQLVHISAHAARLTLTVPFERRILEPRPEAPFNPRFFTIAVKAISPQCGVAL